MTMTQRLYYERAHPTTELHQHEQQEAARTQAERAERQHNRQADSPPRRYLPDLRDVATPSLRPPQPGITSDTLVGYPTSRSPCHSSTATYAKRRLAAPTARLMGGWGRIVKRRGFATHFPFPARNTTRFIGNRCLLANVSPSPSPSPIADEAELLELLTVQARQGRTTAAAKLLIYHVRRQEPDAQPEDGFDALDEVSQRRKRKTG